MIRYIDEHKDRFGVEPIIAVLRGTDAGFLSVPGYYAAKTRPPSARTQRDARLKDVITQVHADNYGVYGVRKMHAALRRDGIEIGRDQTRRLMRELGLAGVRRGAVKRTTIAEAAAARPADLVQRRFSAARPNQLWVCDLTYLRTWAGFAYLALVVDVFSRRIVGWALTTHLRTALPLEALEMAIWDRNERRRQPLDGLIHHSDAGEYTGSAHAHACAEAGVRQSMGRTGSALDNAVAEAFNSTLEFELLSQEHFTTRGQARAAVAAFIDEYNTTRRHSSAGGLSPVAYELAAAARASVPDRPHPQAAA
jgi:putative transposase